MRILHAVHGFFPEFAGGTERYVERLALAQHEAGHAVRLLTGSGRAAEHPSIDHVEHRGLPLYRLHRIGIDIDLWTKSDAPHAEKALGPLLDRLRPDVLHVHHWLRFSRNFVRLAATRGIPVVLTLHDTASTCPRGFRIHRDGHFCEEAMRPRVCLGCAPAYPWQDPGELRLELGRFREAMRAELEAAAVRLVPSAVHGALLARLHGLPVDYFTVRPLGTISSVEPFHGERTPDPDGRLRIVHWGHFREDKGVHVLLDAIARLPDAARDRIHLTLWGEHVFDDYEKRLVTLAAGLPVTFAGPFSPEDLAGADYDVAVFPTLCHESHSFVLDEAFQLRLPVIVSDRGALAERAGTGGLTFRPGDADDLAARLREILDEPAKLGTLARALPGGPQPMTAHARDMIDVYRTAIDRGPPDGVRSPAVTELRLRRARAVETRDVRIAELRWAVAEREKDESPGTQ